MARKNCVLLDTGRRETAAATRDGEKSLLLLDAGRQETTAVDVRWRNPLLLDAERRETTSAGGAAINRCCWSRDGKKSLLLDVGCCWTRDGEKPILLLGVGRTVARNHS